MNHKAGWMFYLLFLCGVVLMPLSGAHGAELASGGTGLLPVKAPELWSSLLKMMASLALILGIMILVFYGLRKFGGGRFGMVGGGRVIRMVANQYLGGKSQVSVVEVDGERLLLGVSPERVTLLSRLGPSKMGSGFSQELSTARERPHPERSQT